LSNRGIEVGLAESGLEFLRN